MDYNLSQRVRMSNADYGRKPQPNTRHQGHLARYPNSRTHLCGSQSSRIPLRHFLMQTPNSHLVRWCNGATQSLCSREVGGEGGRHHHGDSGCRCSRTPTSESPWSRPASPARWRGRRRRGAEGQTTRCSEARTPNPAIADVAPRGWTPKGWIPKRWVPRGWVSLGLKPR